MAIHLLQAKQSDWKMLGSIIGRSFAEDPVSSWTLGSASQIEITFTTLTEQVYLPRGICMIANDVAGTLWLPPGGSKQLPLWSMASMGTRMLRNVHPRHTLRALLVDNEMTRRRPTFPHFYLFAVGVLPEARGQGLGARLINQTLAMADAQKLPAFLENTNPKNHRLYTGLGFEVYETYSPAKGCPEITSMVRQAAAR